MCRCNAVRKSDGKACGLPYGHIPNTHSRADGAVDITWSEEDSERIVPAFILKATDPQACSLIRVWICGAMSHNDHMRRLGEKAPAPLIPQDKILGAEGRYLEFLRWQQDHGTKVPD
jgi:hypothetical protein